MDLLTITGLFLTSVVLFLGCVFCFLAYKIIKPDAEVKFPFTKKDEGDVITKAGRVPIDQFVPRSDLPVTLKYPEKDDITPQ